MKTRLPSNSSNTKHDLAEICDSQSSQGDDKTVIPRPILSATSKFMPVKLPSAHFHMRTHKNIDLHPDSLTQIYDMMNHTKAMRISTMNKDQDNLLMNIGLPNTKRKNRFYRSQVKKLERMAIQDEEKQLYAMLDDTKSAINIFYDTYEEFKVKKTKREKILKN